MKILTQTTKWLLLILVMAAHSTNSQAQTIPEWAEAFYGEDGEAYGITTDKQGNVYVTGEAGFNEGASFQGTSLPSLGARDIYIAKFNRYGSLQWLRLAGGTGNDYGYDIVADDNGGVYITGYCSADAVFGSDTIKSGPTRSMFVAKYDANGNPLWVQAATASTNSNFTGQGIDIDSRGNVYMAGYSAVSGNAVFSSADGNTQTLNGQGWYIVKYEATGNLKWAKKEAGSSSRPRPLPAISKGLCT